MPLAQHVPPIARGYHYALQLGVQSDDDGPFPATAVIVAQLRDYPDGPLSGTLSTADGSLVRVDDHHLQIQAPATATVALGNTVASIDFVRIDGSEPDYLGIRLELPVIVPVTRLGPVFAGGIGAVGAGATTAIVISDLTVTLTRCAPAQVLGALTVAPIAIPVGATVRAPSVTAGSALTAAPSPVGVSAAVPAPAITAVSGQQVSPAAIAAGAVVRAPSVSAAGSLSLAPATIGAAANVPRPLVAAANSGWSDTSSWNDSTSWSDAA